MGNEGWSDVSDRGGVRKTSKQTTSFSQKLLHNSCC